jgi:hypothetical protein
VTRYVLPRSSLALPISHTLSRGCLTHLGVSLSPTNRKHVLFTTVLIVLRRGNFTIVFAGIFGTGFDVGKKATSFLSSEQYGKLPEERASSRRIIRSHLYTDGFLLARVMRRAHLARETATHFVEIAI